MTWFPCGDGITVGGGGKPADEGAAADTADDIARKSAAPFLPGMARPCFLAIEVLRAERLPTAAAPGVCGLTPTVESSKRNSGCETTFAPWGME